MEDYGIYPIGQQDFKTLREDGCLYIDKTAYINMIAGSGSRYYFLARPRRFGKSLFLSTLRYFFEGRRELFKGLYIDSTPWDWQPYPVLRIDLNTNRYLEPGLLDGVLDDFFREWEKKYEVEKIADTSSSRFKNIIKAAHEKTGRQVVILVDEYDKPLVNNLNNPDILEHYRNALANVYSNFKSSAEHIRLVFLTGVTRFSKLSVFSDLNNINDISFDNMYADICGITEKEMLDNLQQGIGSLADTMKISHDEALQLLKENYDGYRFAAGGSDIYNPWSLLSAMGKSEIRRYWADVGHPAVVAEGLKKVHADLEEYFDSYCSVSDLSGLDLLDINPTALLYQSGYLTIKDYDKKFDEVRLGIPNKEVRGSLFRDLLPYYVTVRSQAPNRTVSEIVRGFRRGLPDKAMEALQSYFAGIDYKLRIDNENNFHNAFYLLMDLIGLDTKAEAHTSDGSIDLLIKTEDYIYIIELKYDHSADEALRQIGEKNYSRPFATDPRKVIEIGVSFSSKTRCIEGWKIKQ